MRRTLVRRLGRHAGTLMQKFENIGVVDEARPADPGGRQDALPNPAAECIFGHTVPLRQQAAVGFRDGCSVVPVLGWNKCNVGHMWLPPKILRLYP